MPVPDLTEAEVMRILTNETQKYGYLDPQQMSDACKEVSRGIDETLKMLELTKPESVAMEILRITIEEDLHKRVATMAAEIKIRQQVLKRIKELLDRKEE